SQSCRWACIWSSISTRQPSAAKAVSAAPAATERALTYANTDLTPPHANIQSGFIPIRHGTIRPGRAAAYRIGRLPVPGHAQPRHPAPSQGRFEIFFIFQLAATYFY